MGGVFLFGGGIEMKKIVIISAVFVIIANLVLVGSAGSLETSSTTIRGEYLCVGNPCHAILTPVSLV